MIHDQVPGTHGGSARAGGPSAIRGGRHAVAKATAPCHTGSRQPAKLHPDRSLLRNGTHP